MVSDKDKMTQDGYVEGWSSKKRKGKLPVDMRKSQRSFICLCPGNGQGLSFLCELGSLNPTVVGMKCLGAQSG